jgi:exodeoxyribonuclease V gamma subunit
MTNEEKCNEFNIMPIDFTIEGSHYTRLASLSWFLFAAHELSSMITRPDGYSPEEWTVIFRRIISDFIFEVPANDKMSSSLLERLNRVTSGMEKAGIGKTDFQTMHTVLRSELERHAPPRSFISGKVLFSSLVPMRSIPYKTICLLGMNDTDFPRRPTRPAYDMMAKEWRHGDRIPREEDRYLFLETIISARERLVISYTGRRETDNSIQNPSVVVSELIDYIDKEFDMKLQPEDEGNAVDKDKDNTLRPSHYLVKEYPLQPFSLQYISLENSLVTFAREWFPVDRDNTLIKDRDIPILCGHQDTIPLSEEEQEEIKTVSPWIFASMFCNPSRFFLVNRLNINLRDEDYSLDSTEPFDIDNKDRLFLEHMLSINETRFHELVEDTDRSTENLLEELYQQLRGKGIVPAGEIGKQLWQHYFLNLHNRETINKFIKKQFIKTGLPQGTITTDHKVHEKDGKSLRIAGPIGYVSSSGELIEYTVKVYTGQRLTMWVKHLLSSISEGEPKGSKIVALKSTNVEIEPVTTENASKLLDRLADIYFDGTIRPIPFLPNVSWAFAKALMPKNKKNPGKKHPSEKDQKEKEKYQESIKKAISTISSYNDNRISDKWLRYIYRGNIYLVEKIVTEDEFAELSKAICFPLLEHLTKGR